MAHPARKHIRTTIELTLDEVDAIAADLDSAPTLSTHGRRLKASLRTARRRTEWTRYKDTPKNFPVLRALLRRAAR